MKLLLFAIFSFVIILISNAQNLTHIDLIKAEYGEVNAEKIFEKFEIIPLETNKDALLDIKSATYYLTDKYIIGMNFLQEAYLFDRKTGAFIREISSFGQGPGQYTGILYNRCGFDEKNNILFTSDGSYHGKLWKCINIETNKIESVIKKPLSENDNEIFSAYAPWLIEDNKYVSFCNNRTGKDKVRLIVYDKEGTILKKYPNHLEYDAKNVSSYPSNNGIFYYYNEQTYFKEWAYNDTVFSVSEKNMLPHIVFKLGNKQPSYYHQNNAEYNNNKYLINFVYEYDSVILFNFLVYAELGAKHQSIHTGYYDKRSRRVYISSTFDLRKSGYAIDGIPIRFCPISINRNKEMIARIDPEELMEYKDDIAPEHKHLFKNIQESDNPIVIIAKLK